jgi:thiol:disulfide interchange protein DsbD
MVQVLPNLRIAALAFAGMMGCGAAWGDPPEPLPEPPTIKAPKTKHVKVSLICDQEAVSPGSTVTLGVLLKLDPKWHVYWNGRNENGMPPAVEFKLPEGFTTGPIQWPAPVRYIEPGDLLNHVYFDTVTLIVPLRVARTAKAESTAVIKAHVSLMACEDACVAEQSDVTLKLPIVSGQDLIRRSTDAKAIEAAKARLPRELSKDDREVQIAWTATSVTLSAMAASHMTFYPYEDCVPFADAIKDADADGSSLTITLGEPEKEHTALLGVLEIRRARQDPVFYSIKSAPGKPAPGRPKPFGPTDLPPKPSKPAAPDYPAPGPKPVP